MKAESEQSGKERVIRWIACVVLLSVFILALFASMTLKSFHGPEVEGFDQVSAGVEMIDGVAYTALKQEKLDAKGEVLDWIEILASPDAGDLTYIGKDDAGNHKWMVGEQTILMPSTQRRIVVERQDGKLVERKLVAE